MIPQTKYYRVLSAVESSRGSEPKSFVDTLDGFDVNEKFGTRRSRITGILQWVQDFLRIITL